MSARRARLAFATVLLACSALLPLASVVAAAPAPIAAVRSEEVAFDGYRRGVPVYRLTIRHDARGGVYSLSRKNLQANSWDAPVEVAEKDLAAAGATLKLNGALAGLVPQLPRLMAVSWADLQAAGPPGSTALYERHRSLKRTVGGQEIEATYWAQKDATDPMDLVIGPGGRLLAAIDVSDDSVLVRRGYEAFTTVGDWQSAGVSQPGFGYKALDLQMMPTRGGAKLATRVYLPTGATGPFPTILVRNPYGISELFQRYEQYVVKGYAVVLQAVQGTAYWDPASRSGGTLRLVVQEPDDSADALDWVVKQPWSNGSICMQGLSYHGFTQWAATMARNPALKCIVPESTLGTAFGDQPYMGGTFIQGTPFYFFWMHDRKLLPGRTWSDVLRHRPIRDIDSYATGSPLDAWQNTVRHPTNDSYWQAQNWFRDEGPRDFGAFAISGWFDDDFAGTRSSWALMQKRGTRPNRLIIGPWKHSYNHDRMLNGYSFGADALRDDVWLTKQKFYDFYLKNMRNGVTDPVVDYFVLGSNEWRTAPSWPPPGVVEQTWFLHSRGDAARNSNEGRLSLEPPAAPEPADAYVYDPADPPRNWYSFDLMGDYADVQTFPYDMKDIEDRGDVVSYTSAPLDKDMTIAGNIKLVLYASADVKDTDWWAHIADVGPDNRAKRLSLGVVRARFRKLDDSDYQVFGDNFTREELLSGRLKDIVRYEISLRAIANTFRKGHRIRIAVMNAMDNYSFPNSNTGGNEMDAATTRRGKMRLHHSPGSASHVILPLLPAS